MKMQVRLKKPEKAFLILCLMLFFFLGALLFLDVRNNGGNTARGSDVIGKVLFMQNEVRRRYTSGAAGAGLRQGSDVLYNDSIVTGARSSAGIGIQDGTLVDLCEDSIVTFSRSGNEVMANLEKGCAGIKRTGKGAAGKQMAITVENKRIELNEGEISVARRAGSDPEVFVRKGKAALQINGDRRIMGPNERAVIRPGLVSVEKRKLALEGPADNRSYFISRDKADIEFSWMYDGGGERSSTFNLEISRNRAFSRIEKRVDSKGELAAVSLPEGGFFWRVSVLDPETKRRETSETRRLSVLKDAPVVLLNPLEGESIEYADEPPMINFRWEPHRLASSYVMEISDRSDFSTVIRKIHSGASNFSTLWERSMKPGRSGTYYWRVTADGGPRNWPGRMSAARQFIVKRTEDLISPRLVAPLDGKKMSRLRVDREHVIFSWEKTEDNLKRKILFSKNRSFDSIYREVAVDADHWKMEKSFPSGRYYWRVGVYDDGRKRRAVSGARSFEVRDYEDLALLSPADGSVLVDEEIARKGLHFSWKRPEQQGKFVLELSGDKDFGKIKKAVTTGSAGATLHEVPPGDFYWRVRQFTEDNAVAAASETRAVTIREGITPPEVLFPRAGGAVKMLKENELNFSWKPTKGANAYQLELHQLVKEKKKTRDKLVLSTRTNDHKYTLSDLSLLDVGNFYWTLSAVKKDSKGKVVRSSRKVRNGFTINLGDSKIIIVSPEIQVIEDDTGE